MNPFLRMVQSSKVILAVLAMLAVVALTLFSRRTWAELSVPIGSLTVIVSTLVAAIAREDAAKAQVTSANTSAAMVQNAVATIAASLKPPPLPPEEVPVTVDIPRTPTLPDVAPAAPGGVPRA